MSGQTLGYQGLAVEAVKLFYVFTGIGIAAYDYLCPNLHMLSLHTGLSEQVIGATFIAFGNASVDIFSAFAALHSDNASLAMGSVIGAAFFIICVVVGTLAIAQPSQVIPKAFLRDCGFLIVASTLILFVVADGQISVWESMALIILYVLYAVLVVNTEHDDPRFVHLHGEVDTTRPIFYDVVEHWDTPEPGPRHSFEPGEPSIEAERQAALGSAGQATLRDTLRDTNSHPQSTNTDEETQIQGSQPLTPTLSLQIPKFLLPLPGSPGGSMNLSPHKSIASSFMSVHVDPKTVEEHLFPAFIDWRQKTWLQRINTTVISPVLLVLQLTIPIPPAEPIAGINTIYAVTASWALFGLVLPWTWQAALATAAVCGALMFFGRYYQGVALVAAAGFFLAVLWIMTLASGVVDVVKVLGEAFGVSKAVLGLTVVAIGNSLGDLVSNISIARSDHSTMAFSACFGSPLLLILIGLGGSSAVEMLLSGKRAIPIESSTSIVVTCVLLIVTLLMLMVLLPLNDWRVGPRVGAMCIGVWVLNVTFNLIITFD